MVRMLSNVTKQIAPRYIAGSEVEDAVKMCQLFDQRGWRSTICPWDGPNDTPEVVLSSYQQALHAIHTHHLDCYLSIKAPSLRFDFGRLRELLDIASQYKTRIHFDALGPDTAAHSFDLLEKAATHYKHVGCTLPSRWKRSIEDAKRAITLGVAVRVVKGQWPDPDYRGGNPRTTFLDLIDILSGKAAMVAVASHDISLARESLLRLKHAGTSCELEQLFGLPVRAEYVARPLDINVRVYVPYGCAYLPYALSEINKRPIIITWILKDILLHNLSRRDHRWHSA